MQTLREETVSFLKKHGIRLHTDLGQHFLIDEDALEAIVETAKISSGEEVVEIGPGIGILTRELLREGATVTAIELDRRLIPLLQEWTQMEKNRFTVIQGNALKVPLPQKPYKIVANIPYHITSPLLRHIFLESPVLPSSLTLLIQKEVAQTICSKADAGMLTILVGLFGHPAYVCSVPSSSFLPPPQVDSAVLHVECFANPKTDAPTMEKVFTLTKVGFGQKRKMLRNTIGILPEGIERLNAAGIQPERRPQTLSVDEWIRLAGEFQA